jgi:3-oxoacyl-[acyl-carrier protein] reductase
MDHKNLTMEQILKGKTALITGSTSGIGKSLAIGFAKLGANVVITGRNEERMQITKDEIEKLGVKSIAIRCEVENYKQVQSLVEQVIKEFSSIDILINNAGYSRMKKIARIKPEEFTSILQTNVLGVYNFTHAVVPLMIEAGGGAIINTGSQIVNFPLAGSSAYAMSKSALLSFTEALGVELRQKKISINTIMPNMVDTPLLRSGMTDEELQRLGPMNADELIPYFAFFGTKAGKKVTGLNVNVDIVVSVLKLKADLQGEGEQNPSWGAVKPIAEEKLKADDFKHAKKVRKLIDFLIKI